MKKDNIYYYDNFDKIKPSLSKEELKTIIRDQRRIIKKLRLDYSELFDKYESISNYLKIKNAEGFLKASKWPKLKRKKQPWVNKK